MVVTLCEGCSVEIQIWPGADNKFTLQSKSCSSQEMHIKEHKIYK